MPAATIKKAEKGGIVVARISTDRSSFSQPGKRQQRGKRQHPDGEVEIMMLEDLVDQADQAQLRLERAGEDERISELE